MSAQSNAIPSGKKHDNEKRRNNYEIQKPRHTTETFME
jgi:hypothetical protein